MTDLLDAKIRSLLLEIVDTAPPVPEFASIDQEDGANPSLSHAPDVTSGQERSLADAAKPSWSRNRRISVALGLVVVLIAVALVAWLALPQQQPTSTLRSSRLTVGDLYHRVERAITRPGQVYHQTASATSVGLPHPRQMIESWVDTDDDVARQQLRPPGSAEVVTGGEHYLAIRTALVDSGAAPSCFGSSAALAQILSCPIADSTVNTSQHVERTTLNGRLVVVLVTKIRSTPQAQFRSSSTTRLYLDAKSFLPLAAKANYDSVTPAPSGQGPDVEIHARRHTSYRSDFTQAQSLPDNFFTPASIAAWASATSPD
jgi:hypothetical protein